MGYIFEEFPTFETERLRLRKLSLADVDDLYDYASDERVTTYLFWETHQSKADSEKFINYALQQYEKKGIAPWGIELKQKSKTIGTIDFVSWDEEHHSAEIGYVLSKTYQGKGLMTEAAKAILHYCFNERKLNRLQARCHIDNKASEAVMKKLGMTYEGTHRQAMYVKNKFWDMLVYAIIKEDYIGKQKNL